MTAPRNPHPVPVWLLDIDGVVNAVARRPVSGSWPRSAWVHTVIRTNLPGLGPTTLPILAAQPVLDFVEHIYDTGAAEVIWHSTWRESAMTELAPALGLPAIPVSTAPEWTQRSAGIWWKLPAAQRVLASGRPLVWTDDDLAGYADQLGDITARSDALLICPHRTSGLTSADLDRIVTFLAQ